LGIFLPAGSFEFLQYRTILQPLKETIRFFVIKPPSLQAVTTQWENKPRANRTGFADTSLFPTTHTVKIEDRLNAVPLPRTFPNRPTQGKLSYRKTLDLLAWGFVRHQLCQ